MMLWKRLAYLLPWRRRAAERDMQDELESIAEMATPGELGNLTLAAEDARAQWGWTRLEQTGQDLRYAAHAAQEPAYATAVLSLALHRANAAFFTHQRRRGAAADQARAPLLLEQRDEGNQASGFTFQRCEPIRDHNRVGTRRLWRADGVSIDGRPDPVRPAGGPYFPAWRGADRGPRWSRR